MESNSTDMNKINHSHKILEVVYIITKIIRNDRTIGPPSGGFSYSDSIRRKACVNSILREVLFVSGVVKTIAEHKERLS